MNPTQRLPASLTPLDVARGHLIEGLEPVTPVDLPLADALRSIAAEMPPLAASPARDVAAADGFALVVPRSRRCIVLFAVAARIHAALGRGR